MAEYSLDDVIGSKQTYTLDEVVGSKQVKAIDSIPRQLGLTARYVAEGLSDTAGIFSDPLSAVINKATGSELMPLGQATRSLLDKAGLPSPKTAQERVVGDASRLLSGTGGLLKTSVAIPSKAVSMFAANPSAQAASSAGAGYAGGVARENGGGAGSQIGASIVGGLLAPTALSAVNKIATTGRNAVNNINSAATANRVNTLLTKAGIDDSTLGSQALQSIRKDVATALSNSDDISVDALRRLSDYRAVGAQPMRSNLTLNPADITKDRNLAKLGANSTDAKAQQLAMMQNKNNKVLIDNLNDLGANTADDAYSAGQKLISALEGADDSARASISSLYEKARNTSGRSAQLDPYKFTQRANDLLDESLLGGKLPSDVRNLLNRAAKGEMPLTVDTAEQFKTRIGDLQRATMDRAERKALSLVRQALDETPVADELGEQSIKAFNQARQMNRDYMGIVEKTPALKAVRDGVEPDKFVKQFILSNGSKSNVSDVAQLRQSLGNNPEAIGAVRGQILSHLKGKALSGASDEAGNFSPSAFNRALNDIGDRKLGVFFQPDEIEQLKRVGRVATYEKFQPTGSAVNNSNTAGAVVSNALDFIGSYVPLGDALVRKPIGNISNALDVRGSLNTPNALISNTVPKQGRNIPVWPIVGMPGLLSE